MTRFYPSMCVVLLRFTHILSMFLYVDHTAVHGHGICEHCICKV